MEEKQTQKQTSTDTKISPAQYNEMLKYLDLLDITVSDFSGKLIWRPTSKEMIFRTPEKVSQPTILGDRASVTVSYSMEAEADQKAFLTLRVNFDVSFKLSGVVTEEFFEIYNATSLPIQTYPYFREFVSWATVHFGLPQLTLPLRKYLFPDQKIVIPARD